MKNIRIFLYITLLLCILPFFSCSSSDKKMSFKFGMTAISTSNEYESAEFLKNYVEEKSKGLFTIELFPNSQLGDDRDMIEQLQGGTLDITYADTGRLGLWVPRASIFQAAYVFDNPDHMRRVLYETEEGKKLRENILSTLGIHILGYSYNGTRQTTSNRPINSIEDMKGLKLRVPNAQANLDYAEYVGASPTPLAFTEVYLALQTKSVDAQENPLPTIKAKKFYEVQKHIALTSHIINDMLFLVGDISWEKLSPKYQKMLSEGIEKAAQMLKENVEKQEAELIAFFEQQGAQVTRPDLEPFRMALQAARKSYLEKNGEEGQKILDAIASVR